MKRRKRARAIACLSCALLFLVACSAPAPASPAAVSNPPTATAIGPTDIPIPLEMGEPVRTIKLTSDANGNITSEETPFMMSAFGPNGDPAPGLSASFESTTIDLSAIPEKDRAGGIPIGVQVASKKIQNVVSVDTTALEAFSIDKNNIVSSPGMTRVENGGPFVRLIFKHQAAAQGADAAPIDGWEITVSQDDRTLSGKLSSDGVYDVSHVTLTPIHCTLKDPASSKTYEYVAFPAFRAAAKGLVLYKIRDIDSPDYEAK